MLLLHLHLQVLLLLLLLLPVSTSIASFEEILFVPATIVSPKGGVGVGLGVGVVLSPSVEIGGGRNYATKEEQGDKEDEK